MRSRSPPTEESREGNFPDVRRQLVALIQQGRRSAHFSRKRPSDLRFGEVPHPESGMALTRRTAWLEIVRVLEANAPLRKTQLDKPWGATAWVCRARLGRDQPLVYIKLELVGGSRVLLRSFHRDEHCSE